MANYWEKSNTGSLYFEEFVFEGNTGRRLEVSRPSNPELDIEEYQIELGYFQPNRKMVGFVDVVGEGLEHDIVIEYGSNMDDAEIRFNKIKWDNRTGGRLQIYITTRSEGEFEATIKVSAGELYKKFKITGTSRFEYIISDLVNFITILVPRDEKIEDELYDGNMPNTEEQFKINIEDYAVIKDNEIGSALIKSPDTMGADYKDFESINYPEEHGRRMLINTSLKEFTYRVDMCFIGFNELLANKKLEELAEKIMNGRKIILLNRYKRVGVVGYVVKHPNVTNVMQRDKEIDIVFYSIEVEVENPKECVFNLVLDE